MNLETDDGPLRGTFRGRLTVSMTLLAVAVLAVANSAIYLRVRQAMLSHLDSTLLSIARTEVASSVDQPGGDVHVHEEVAPLSGPGDLGYEKFVLIKDENGQVRAQNPISSEALPSRPTPSARPRHSKGKSRLPTSGATA